MSIEKIRYSEDWKERWDSFVSGALNGTFLHLRGFYDHNPANAPEDHSLLFLKKNKIVAVLPLSLYERSGRRILHSYLRATYGGFITSAACGVVEAIEIVNQVVDEAQSLVIDEIIIRNPFRVFYQQISDEFDYALWYHHFVLKTREVEVYVDLTADLATIRKRYENGARYNVKKACKFVAVSESKELQIFWPILIKNLAEKHNQLPVHQYPDILRLINNVGEDKVKLFAGFHEDNMICGCVIFVMGKTLHAQYIGQDSKYQELRPVNAVVDFIIQWGHENGFSTFNLGSANEGGGRIINEGLFHFKEGFGGRAVLRETMHLELQKN